MVHFLEESNPRVELEHNPKPTGFSGSNCLQELQSKLPKGGYAGDQGPGFRGLGI